MLFGRQIHCSIAQGLLFTACGTRLTRIKKIVINLGIIAAAPNACIYVGKTIRCNRPIFQEWKKVARETPVTGTPTIIFFDSCTCSVSLLRSRIAETCREINVATLPTEISTGISCSTSGQVHKKVESDERGHHGIAGLETMLAVCPVLLLPYYLI